MRLSAVVVVVSSLLTMLMRWENPKAAALEEPVEALVVEQEGSQYARLETSQELGQMV